MVHSNCSDVTDTKITVTACVEDVYRKHLFYHRERGSANVQSPFLFMMRLCCLETVAATAKAASAAAHVAGTTAFAAEVRAFIHALSLVAQVLASSLCAKEVDAIDKMRHHVAVHTVGFSVSS